MLASDWLTRDHVITVNKSEALSALVVGGKGLVWFGFIAAGTTVTSRVPTGDNASTLLRITQPSSSTVASEEFGIHIRSGDLK